ncbi:hypothetical protein ABKN59_002890 [Abortiporus biennis]
MLSDTATISMALPPSKTTFRRRRYYRWPECSVWRSREKVASNLTVFSTFIDTQDINISVRITDSSFPTGSR